MRWFVPKLGVAALVWAAVVALCASGIPGCSGAISGSEPPLRIVVTIAPLVGLVRPLVPLGSEIKVLMPPGRSEHGYEMTSADFAAVNRAHVLVYVGLGLEPKIEEFVRRRPSPGRTDLCFAKVVGIEAASNGENHEAHDHEGEHAGHDHGPVDPHLWLDPVLVKQLVPAIREAVEEAETRRGLLTPEELTRLNEAATGLEKQVQALHEEAEQRLFDLTGASLVTHHAAWERLASRYGLQVAAVLRPIETSEPTPAAIAAAIDVIRREQVKAIFVEPQYDRTAAAKVADATGVQVCTLDPLGDGDWFAMMRKNVQTIQGCLGTKTMVDPSGANLPLPAAPIAPGTPAGPGR